MDSYGIDKKERCCGQFPFGLAFLAWYCGSCAHVCLPMAGRVTPQSDVRADKLVVPAYDLIWFIFARLAVQRHRHQPAQFESNNHIRIGN
jgi:hypothetical protein